MPKIDKARIERAARIYPSNQDAGLALGIAPGMRLLIDTGADVTLLPNASIQELGVSTG